MNLDSLTLGQKIAGATGVLAFINLFLPWYGIGGAEADLVRALGGPTSINAWNSGLGAWGGSLLIIAAAGVLMLKAFGTTSIEAGKAKTEQIALGLAGLGTLLIVLRMLTQMSFSKVGLWFGVILAGTMVFAAITAMKEQGLALPTMDDVKSMTQTQTPTAQAPTAPPQAPAGPVPAPTMDASTSAPIPPAPPAPPVPPAPPAG